MIFLCNLRNTTFDIILIESTQFWHYNTSKLWTLAYCYKSRGVTPCFTCSIPLSHANVIRYHLSRFNAELELSETHGRGEPVLSWRITVLAVGGVRPILASKYYNSVFSLFWYQMYIIILIRLFIIKNCRFLTVIRTKDNWERKRRLMKYPLDVNIDIYTSANYLDATPH